VNTRTLARGLATLTVTAGIGIAGSVAVDASALPSPSPVTTPTSPALLAGVKSLCNIGVQRRVAVLAADDTFVETSVALTGGDQSTLEGQISADKSGLTQLDQTIQSDTTYAKVLADCGLIVTNYRVYVMEDPKIHEVIAADGVGKVDGAFTTVIPELQNLISTSTMSAAVKAEAQADLNTLNSKVTASQTAISGVSASVINLVPSGWPGNQSGLKSARQNIVIASTDLSGARTDVRDILTLLG
jgi:cell division protein FtsL